MLSSIDREGEQTGISHYIFVNFSSFTFRPHLWKTSLRKYLAAICWLIFFMKSWIIYCLSYGFPHHHTWMVLFCAASRLAEASHARKSHFHVAFFVNCRHLTLSFQLLSSPTPAIDFWHSVSPKIRFSCSVLLRFRVCKIHTMDDRHKFHKRQVGSGSGAACRLEKIFSSKGCENIMAKLSCWELFAESLLRKKVENM